jgi:hypothetical protein
MHDIEERYRFLLACTQLSTCSHVCLLATGFRHIIRRNELVIVHFVPFSEASVHNFNQAAAAAKTCPMPFSNIVFPCLYTYLFINGALTTKLLVADSTNKTYNPPMILMHDFISSKVLVFPVRVIWQVTIR